MTAALDASSATPMMASRLRMPEYRGRNVPRDGLLNSPQLPGGHSRESLELQSAGRSRLSRGAELREDVDRGSGSLRPSRCDHIRVAVRVRPLPAGEEGIIEVSGNGAIAIRKEAATGGNEALKSQQGRIEERQFNHVFGPDATQKEVYSWGCAPLVSEAVAKGRSATIFVYGATGAGKTHTMFGNGQDREQQGLIFRAIPEVFEAISRCEDEAEGSLEVKVSFLEIYNEVVRDLLQGGGGSQCRVMEDERKGVVKIANLLEATARNPEEALWYLKSGMQARTVEATAANAQSSRAHAVFSLTIESVKSSETGSGIFARRGEVRTLHSKISLIDLAGSERAGVTQNSGAALKDGARINQSLLALANCIDALTAKGPNNASTPRKKPPYRDSKLTLMLKGSLVGDGLVAMIANVNPGRSHFEDSNNTLEYAKRASTVKTATPAVRRKSRADTLSGHEEGIVQRGQRSCDDELCEELEGCTLSSSSIPVRPNSSNLTHRRILERNRTCATSKSGSASETRTSTTVPEECLSEISLSSPGGADFETPCRELDEDEDVDVEGVAHSIDDAEGSDSARSWADTGKASDPEKENRPSLGRCGSTPAKSRPRFSQVKLAAKTEDLETKVDCTVTRTGPAARLQRSGALEDVIALALEHIKKLQTEKASLDAHLERVLQERNSLLKDREVLEEDNRELRASGSAKDRQIAQLLAGIR